MSNRARLVVLASGTGTNLQAIMDACTEDKLEADVVAVLSDRRSAYALERASKAGIPTIYHPWKPYRDAGESREQYDADLAQEVKSYNPDLIVMAGWMRILSMAFLEHFPMKVINLHPALPATFPGTHAIQRAWDAYQAGQISHTGVMVHYVPDEGVDDGPVITEERVAIAPLTAVEELEERIHRVEHRLLLNAIQSVLRGEKN